MTSTVATCPDCGSVHFLASEYVVACFDCNAIYRAPARTKAERPVEDDLRIHPDWLDMDVPRTRAANAGRTDGGYTAYRRQRVDGAE